MEFNCEPLELNLCLVLLQPSKCHASYKIALLVSPVVVGHGSQSMTGLSIDSSSVAMNLRTMRISKSKKKIQLQELEITKMEVSPFLVV